MLKNYLKSSWRNLRRSGSYSIINMVGLASGIMCTLLILLWVVDEVSFDRFLPKSDRLYKIMANVTYDGQVHTWGAVALGAYDEVKAENPHVTNTCAVDWGNKHLLSVGDKRITKRGHYATTEFLSMFEFGLQEGEVKTCLADPGSIVITEALAKALFGDKDAMNKTIRIDNQHEQKVTGILANVPDNSTFQFEFLLPWGLHELDPWVKKARTSWENYSFGVYVELDDNANKGVTEAAIKNLPSRHDDKEPHKEFFLYPLTQWRLYSVFENGIPVKGGIEYVKLFGAIAVFVLLIACINFMNLSTARSERRAKEVGVRKSVGSSRGSLVRRFLGESILVALISFVMAVLLTEIALPFYNNLVQKKLFINYMSIEFWLFSVGLILLVGLVSGSYPAFYLSSFNPVKILKGKVTEGKGGSTPRKILVTLQFGFSIVLLIATLVVYRQIQFVKQRDMGFQKDNLLMVTTNEDIQKHYRVIKEQLLASGVVESVTRSNSTITSVDSWSFLNWPGKPESQKVLFTNVATEYDYTKTMGIRILQGRDFSEDFKSDTSAILINQAALDLMGLKDPIGQELSLSGGQPVKLIGVLENTIMMSPSDAVMPMFVQFVPNWFNAMTIRIRPTNDLPGTLQTLESVFKKYAPEYPFEYRFADVEFQKKFSEINLAGTLANLFTFLTIVITGMGLFGLASFAAEQRTREMGIRKVLGATVSNLVVLMSGDFSKLLAIAFLIAAPSGWWMVNQFLQRYQYRVEMPWWAFPLAGAVAFVFSTAIVSTQALRAAKANPAQSLKNE